MPMWDGSMTLTVFAFTNQILPSDAFVAAGLEPLAIATSRTPSALSNVVTWTVRLGSEIQASISVRGMRTSPHRVYSQ